MNPLFQTVTDLDAQADILAVRRHGVVEMVEGRLVGVHLRPWPKIVSLPQVWLGRQLHRWRRGNRCLLYYNQPWRFPNFLALVYMISSGDCTLGTMHGSLEVLDEIARIKRTDAILCEASNGRISDRLMARWGWQPHKPSIWHRHFIKRFYGRYDAANCSCSRPGALLLSRLD